MSVVSVLLGLIHTIFQWVLNYKIAEIAGHGIYLWEAGIYFVLLDRAIHIFMHDVPGSDDWD